MFKSVRFTRLIGPLIVCGMMAACTLSGDGSPIIASGVTDINGLVRIESAAGVMDFQVSSGLTGDKLPGIRVKIAAAGATRFIYAEDPTGWHLPLAVPLAGEATVRRLVVPPKSGQGYNIATAAGPLDLADLTSLGALSEAAVRQRMAGGPDVAVLIYLYNPARPLQLTGAALDAYATPFDNVTVLKAGGEPSDAQLALVIVGLRREAYNSWSNLKVDRYLAARVGQPPDLDLRDDLAFRWAYPVFEVYPPEDTLNLEEDESALLTVSWRSANPDPPPPWSLFVSSDNPAVTVSPEQFPLGPDTPPQQVTISVDRSSLEPGDYTATILIQPFSDTFGLIEQRVERVVSFAVEPAPPTPTPGPSVESLTITPDQPRVGDTLEIKATGFAPGENVLVEFSGEAYNLSDALPLSDATGAFTYQIDLSEVPPGDYSLRIVGAESSVTGAAAISVLEALPDAVVASDELNVRYQPFPDSPVLEVLVKGDVLDVISVNGDDSWIEVITSTGTRGWVLTRLVTLYIDLANVPWNSAYPAP